MEKAIIDYEDITWDEPGIEEWIEEHSKELDENGNEIINEDLRDFLKSRIYLEIFDNGDYSITAPDPLSINENFGYYNSNTNTIIKDGTSGYEWDREEFEKIGEIEEVE